VLWRAGYEFRAGEGVQGTREGPRAQGCSPIPLAVFPPVAAGVLALGGRGRCLARRLPGAGPSDDRDTDRWYHNLEKSRATPPDYVFGVVWPAIEAASAYAGYRLLTRPSGPNRNGALGFLASTWR
jgi:hypothetical protein